jgi:hypothetical protein
MQGQGFNAIVIAQLTIQALTPIMTATIALVILILGTRLERSKQLHRSLLDKRMSLFEEIAPGLNDVYCFYQTVGHWSDLNPDEIIKRKRTIDRAVNVNRHLFRKHFWEVYKEFENAHFEMFSSVGQPARLRLDTNYMRERIGPHFKKEWEQCVSSAPGDRKEQIRSYDILMDVLGSEVKGEAS